MKFLKSKYNIAMLTIAIVAIVFMAFNSLAPILMPIGLDLLAIVMFMGANSIYNVNKERVDLDEVDGRKMTFDATKISVDEDVYYVEETDKKLLMRKKVKKYNNTMSFCVLLTIFGFIMIGITIGIYIGFI